MSEASGLTDWPDDDVDWDAFLNSDGALSELSVAHEALFPHGQVSRLTAGALSVLEVRGDAPSNPQKERLFYHSLLAGSGFINMEPVLEVDGFRAIRSNDAGTYAVAWVEGSESSSQLDLLRLVLSSSSYETIGAYPVIDVSAVSVDISNNGNVLLFETTENLTDETGDQNFTSDIFTYDCTQGTFSRISERSDGSATEASSLQPALNGDGTVIVYLSDDTEIVEDDQNGTRDVFLYDCDSGETQLLSKTTEDVQADADCENVEIDSSGRFVVFTSSSSTFGGYRTVSGAGVQQVYLADAETGYLRCLSVDTSGSGADADCLAPAISPNGRYVTFSSNATNLASDCDGTYMQVFLVDRGDDYLNYPPETVSAYRTCQYNDDGETTNSVDFSLEGTDEDGDALAYQITALTPADAGAYTLSGGASLAVGSVIGSDPAAVVFTPAEGFLGTAVLQFVANDGVDDSRAAQISIQVGDFANGVVDVASANDADEWADGASPAMGDYGDTVGISGDGRLVVFSSDAENLSDGVSSGVYLRDESEHKTYLVQAGTQDFTLRYPTISSQGNALAYVLGGTVYCHTITVSDTVTIGTAEELTCPDSSELSLSADGETLIFETETALSDDDADTDWDVYLWRPVADELVHLSAATDTVALEGDCRMPSLSGDGRLVAFVNSNTIWLWSTDGTAPVSVVEISTDTLKYPALSYSGRFLSYRDGDLVYVHDIGLDENVLTLNAPCSLSASSAPALTPDARYVYLTTTATDLPLEAGVPQPDGTRNQAFRCGVYDGTVVPLNYVNGVYSSNHSYRGELSDTGEQVAFVGRADVISTEAGSLLQALHWTGPVIDNSLPEATLSEVAVVEDTVVEDIVLSYTHADGGDVRIEITQPPAHAAEFEVTGVGPLNPWMMFRYLPEADYNGTDTLVYRVGDSHGWSDPQEVTLNVTAVDDPPVIGDVPSQAVAEGDAFDTVDLGGVLTEVDADSVEWSWSLVGSDRGAPTGDLSVVIDQVNGTAAVSVPDENWNGSQTIRFTVTDNETEDAEPTTGGYSASVDVVFTVTAQDDAPSISSFTVSAIDEGSAFDTIDLTAYTVEVDGDEVSYSGSVLSTRGAPSGDLSVEVSGSGVATVSIPDENWNGSQTIRFTVTDQTESAASGSLDVVFAVNAVDDAPVISSFTVSAIDEGSVFDTIDLTAYTVEVDGDEVSYSGSVLSTRGAPSGDLSVEVSGSGVATVSIPDENWNGSQTVRFRVTDQTESAKSGSLDVVFAVNAVDEAPVVAPIADQTIGEATVFEEIDLDALLTEYDGDSVTWSWTGNSELVVSTNAATGGIVVAAPDADWFGQETITFTATDDTEGRQADSAAATFVRKHYTLMTLAKGWNLVSFPISLTEESWQQFMASVDRPGWIWQGSAYALVDADSAPLAAGIGAWFLRSESSLDAPIELLGDLPTASGTVFSAGWNLVGPIGAGDLASIPFTDIEGGEFTPSVTWRWLSGFYKPVLDGVLHRNRGYWIRAETAPSAPVGLFLTETE